ncbi:MAG: hypothetical protein KAT43_02890 [Nanoarchaeota archaeon]|nr:hypothetical protein [Nanoarchaeota archaeon]
MADEFDRYKRELERRRKELLKLTPGPRMPSRKAPQPPRYKRLPPVHEAHTRTFAHKRFWLCVIVIVILIIVLALALNFTQKDITEEELAKIREAKFLETIIGEEPELMEIIPEDEKEMRALEDEIEQGFKDMGAAFNIRNFKFTKVGDHIEIVHELDTMTVDFEDGRHFIGFLENIDLRDPLGKKITWFNNKYSTAATIEVEDSEYQTITRTFREPVSMFDLRGTYCLKIRATDITPFVKDEKTFEFEIE